MSTILTKKNFKKLKILQVSEYLTCTCSLELDVDSVEVCHRLRTISMNCPFIHYSRVIEYKFEFLVGKLISYG